eukprot:scaffold3759_cov169-Amphora_coffeaeformis.AAC.11
MADGPIPAPSLLLKTALFRGDMPSAIKAVHDGANTHLVSRDSRTPFMTPVWIALSLGFDEMALFLLRHEPKPARPTMRREFAMACGETTGAATAVSLDNIHLVVDYFGPEIVGSPAVTVDAFTPFHYACSSCDWPLIQYLVAISQQQQGANQHWATQKATHHQLTPLHVLRYNEERTDDLEHFLAWILEQEENPEHLFAQQDAEGRTALEAIFQHADTNTRNFCVTWMVTTRRRC